ncbi:MAG: TorF family putative porin [Enterobacterales bacterium]|nr:TorF family putative porin [Enterobacterales bacterium]
MPGSIFQKNGFNIGTWAADVDDGVEVDIYGGYAIELENGISLGLSATSYQYTGTFDSAYNELTLSAGFGLFSLDYSKGTWDGAVTDPLALTQDYTILILGVEYEGFSGQYGTYGDQFNGDYFDLSYSTTISELEVGVGLLISSKELDDDESLYFSLSKSFDF